MIEIILLEPEIPGNIGAVARVMKNFGFENLVLIDPCEITEEAKNRAKHAQDVLNNSEIRDQINWKDYNLVIGTTGVISGEYEVIRNAITPKKLREKFKRVEGKTGIVFGREGIGLKNEELEKCDLTLHIPTSDEYSILNLSHAVGIVLYELFETKKEEIYELIGKEEKQVLLKVFKCLTKKVNYEDYRRKKVYQSFKNLIGRGMVSKRESHTLIGFLKAIMRDLNKRC